MATTKRDRRTTGTSGVLLVALGAVLALLSIVGLRWYAVDSGADTAGDGFTFADLHSNADQLNAPIASAYFDWLAWTLLIAVVVVGLAANLPTPVADVLRVVGFVIGVVGVVGTYYSLAQLFNAQHAAGASDHSVLHSSTLGVWCALAGFAIAGFGAVLGPRATV